MGMRFLFRGMKMSGISVVMIAHLEGAFYGR